MKDNTIMVEIKSGKESFALSTCAFVSLALGVATYGLLWWMVSTVTDANFESIQQFGVTVAVAGSFLVLFSFLFCVAAMSKKFTGEMVAMVIITLVGFLGSAASTVYFVMRLFGQV